MSSEGEFKKGDLVLIEGLQSDAGKKLNGKHGIILGKPKESKTDGILRYPVRLYESGEHPRVNGWDDTVIERKLKKNNVCKFPDQNFPPGSICTRCNKPTDEGDGVCRHTHPKDKIMQKTTMMLGDYHHCTYMCWACFGRFEMDLQDGKTFMDEFSPGGCDRDPSDTSNIKSGRKYCFEGPHKVE